MGSAFLQPFAGLNILDGKVIGRRAEDRRNREVAAFLDRLDKDAPDMPNVHAILDNCAVHMHRVVTGWLAEHPR